MQGSFPRFPLIGKYDFTRCVRPNGTAYGTGGTCRKGVESAAEEKPKRGRPKKVRKPLAEMSASERREEIERRVKETVRTLRKEDPEKLKQDWIAEHNKGRTPQEFPSGLRMAKDLAAKRIKEQAKQELGTTESKKVDKVDKVDKEAKPRTLQERMEDALRREREARDIGDEAEARKAMREHMALVKQWNDEKEKTPKTLKERIDDAFARERAAREAGDEEAARKAMREHMALVKQRDEEEDSKKEKRPPLDARLEDVDALYKKLGALRKRKLDPDEMWQIESVEEEIRTAKQKAYDEAVKLKEGKKEAIERVDDETFKGFIKTRTQDEIHAQVSRLQLNLQSTLGNEDEKDLRDTSIRRLSIAIENVSDPQLRALYESNLGRLTGQVKAQSPGSLRETLNAGESFLKKHNESLRSSASIIRRANQLEQAIRSRQEELVGQAPESDKMWVRLSLSLTKLDRRRQMAEDRLDRRMTRIREEMTQTTLSEKEVRRLTDLIPIGSPVGAKKLSATESAENRRHIEDFVRMFNGKGLQDIEAGGDYRSGLERVMIDANQRAFARSSEGFVMSNGTQRTLFHEIGHVVEHQRPWLVAHAENWRNSSSFTLEKAQNDRQSQALIGGGGGLTPIPYRIERLGEGQIERPVFKLADMHPLRNRKYEEDEVAVVNNFMTPYLGKVYKHKSTEVVSLTLEHFSDPRLMSYLYIKHPDLFTLGVGLSQT